MSIPNTLATRIAVGIIAAAMLVAMSFAVAVPNAQAALSDDQIQSILDLLSSFDADQTTIDNVEASLKGETPSGGGGGTGNVPAMLQGHTFATNLSVGTQSDEARKVQVFINEVVPGMQVASSGPGSPGNETAYYGSLTASAVTKFQEKYSAEVLAPVGLSAGTTYWGPSSRAHANALLQQAQQSDSGDTGDTGDTGSDADFSGLKIMSADQPSNELAPTNASRVAFTNIEVMAGRDDVTINSVDVKRTGSGSNNAFDGIVLLKEDGTQLGNAKTLNSNNRATVGSSVTVEAGETMTLTVAGNMQTSDNSNDGQQLALQVDGINTSASIDGTLPITGATHTVNESLSIGSATVKNGANDPGTGESKEVGTQDFTFSGVRITAGSTESISLKSLRWEQSGSVSADDLDNVKVVIDSTEYDTTRSGDYYTVVLPDGGLSLDEGKSVETYIKGDIVGGADRKVDFDIERKSDIHVVGEELGYGITPDGNTSSTGEGTANTGGTQPFYNGFEHDVTAGAVTVTVTNDVPAGNVANDGDDVNLASFKFDVDGEDVTWDSIDFTISTSSGGSTAGALTNIVLVDSNGNTISGPADPTAKGDSVTLADTATLSSGETVVFVRGDLDGNWSSDDTIQIQFDPSSDISSLEGDTTGNSITAGPSSTLNAKTQTVKAASLTVSASGQLASQSIINEASDVELGRFTFDATDSGEDLRVNTAKIKVTTGVNSTSTDLSSLRLVDGDGNNLQSSSNYVDPSSESGNTESLTFTISGGFIAPKGTSMTVKIVGNVNHTGTPDSKSTYKFDTEDNSNWSVTGVDSVNSVTPTLNNNNNATMTLKGSGTLTASVADSDPSEEWYVSGDTGTVGVFNFDSADETMTLTDLGLQLDTATSSSPDIDELSFWDGSTEILTKNTSFTGNSESFDLDASATNDFTVDADTDKDLTVKAKFASIGTNQVGQSGNLIRLATTTTASDNQARGVESGSTVDVSGAAHATTTGARYFKSLPTLATVDGSDCSTDTSISGGTDTIYCFSVSADANGRVLVEQFTFNVATTSATASSLKLTQVNGSKAGSIVDQSLEADSSNNVKVQVDSNDYGQNYISVPAGDTVTFKLEATTQDGSDDNGLIRTKLLEDTAFPSLASGPMAQSATIDSENFVWSPRSTTSNINTNDWTNGYRVPGLKFSDLNSQSITD